MLVVAASATPGACAGTYNNAEAHYRFDFPAGWTPDNASGVDTVILGIQQGGFTPNVVATHESEPTAQNTSAWLFAYVRSGLDEFRAQTNATEVQAPRTFTAATGRLAGDYIVEWSFSGTTVRQRQVFFVSVAFRMAYLLTFSDKPQTFNTHASDWNLVVDSFAVEGEPVESAAAPSSALTLIMYAGIAVGAGGTLFAVALVMVRRRGARPRAPTAPELEAAPATPMRRPIVDDIPSPPPIARPAQPPAYSYAAGPASYSAAPADTPWGPPVTGGTAASRAASSATRQQRPVPPPPPRGAPAAALGSPAGGTRPATPPSPSLGTAPLEGVPPGSASRANLVRCPKCSQLFPGPTTRPALVKCPACGTAGRLR